MGDGTRATRARQLVWRQGTSKRLRAGDLDGGKEGGGGGGQLKGPGSLRATVSLISLL